MIEAVISALLLGVLGAGHCLGMCGGFAAALAYAIPAEKLARRFALLLAYNVGRISSYALLGALAALGQNAIYDSGYPLARTIAGLLLIATGLYQAELWTGITVLERGGQKIWRYIQPLSQRLLPVYTVPKALLLGAFWGWLPCGLVYSVLVLAATQPGVTEGALTMAAFGAGTLPAVFAGGLAASWVRKWLARRWFKMGLAGCFILFGIWTIAVAWYHHSHHGGHHSHQGSSDHGILHHGTSHQGTSRQGTPHHDTSHHIEHNDSSSVGDSEASDLDHAMPHHSNHH